jgi:hypothetical protein
MWFFEPTAQERERRFGRGRVVAVVARDGDEAAQLIEVDVENRAVESVARVLPKPAMLVLVCVCS